MFCTFIRGHVHVYSFRISIAFSLCFFFIFLLKPLIFFVEEFDKDSAIDSVSKKSVDRKRTTPVKAYLLQCEPGHRCSWQMVVRKNSL